MKAKMPLPTGAEAAGPQAAAARSAAPHPGGAALLTRFFKSVLPSAEGRVPATSESPRLAPPSSDDLRQVSTGSEPASDIVPRKGPAIIGSAGVPERTDGAVPLSIGGHSHEPGSRSAGTKPGLPREDARAAEDKGAVPLGSLLIVAVSLMALGAMLLL